MPHLLNSPTMQTRLLSAEHIFGSRSRVSEVKLVRCLPSLRSRKTTSGMHISHSSFLFILTYLDLCSNLEREKEPWMTVMVIQSFIAKDRNGWALSSSQDESWMSATLTFSSACILSKGTTADSQKFCILHTAYFFTRYPCRMVNAWRLPRKAKIKWKRNAITIWHASVFNIACLQNTYRIWSSIEFWQPSGNSMWLSHAGEQSRSGVD